VVQLRHPTKLTSEEYVKQQAWKSASLEHCPLHPKGGCGLARHTPYARVEPPGMWVSRWYCAEGHTTFSLLPDCLASRLSSTLTAVEEVARAVEERQGTVEEVAQKLRPEIGVQGALRWVRRRVVAVRQALSALKGLRPDLLSEVVPTLAAVGAALSLQAVLVGARELSGAQVSSLPPCIGFGPRPERGGKGRRYRQQGTGADPP
jgi:hypothetical protein